MKQGRKKKAKKKTGPKPDTLKIEGDWKDAVKKALHKDPPVSGWPKPSAKRRNQDGKAP